MTDDELRGLTLQASQTPAEVVDGLTKAFERYSGDENYRAGMKRAVPGVRAVYGVRVPQLRALSRQVNKTFKTQVGAIEAIAEGCWQLGSREHCVLGILILAGNKSLSAEQRWELGTRYLPEVGDWETCDQLCNGLLGQALAEEPGFMDVLEGWVEAPNFWVRRAALATTVMLRRSTAPLAIRKMLDRRTLDICLQLLDDEQHYVRKAVDWAIRELIRRDYELGSQWMLERSQTSPGPVARSILKKSAKKLSPKDQGRFFENLR